jgi:hypothetical protein
MAATVDQGRSRDVLPGGDVLAHHTMHARMNQFTPSEQQKPPS